jgi:hypothetical protein
MEKIKEGTRKEEEKLRVDCNQNLVISPGGAQRKD